MFYNNNNISSRPPGPSCLKVDSAIQCINLYPVDSTIGFPNSYPVDSGLSSGYCRPVFEQLGPDLTNDRILD